MSASTMAVRTGRGVGRTIARLAAPILGALLAFGCSGDVDPLEEAIEVRELDLASLSIVRPPDTETLEELVVNPGDRLRFSLAGVNATGGPVDGDDLNAVGRNWRVSDPSVATIDANGELVALEDGVVTVDASIGDIVASGVGVEVRLAAATSIERVVGTDPIDPCTIERYAAIGGFSDRSVRLLTERSGLSWEVAAAGVERFAADGDGSVRLAASRPGMFELVARLGDAALTEEIVVLDSLDSLAIGPAGALTVAPGETLELSAIGTFTGTDGVVRERVVTDALDWAITAGDEFASVGDEPATRGRITAIATGTAEVRASCNEDVSALRQVRVRSVETDASTSTGLAFRGATGGDPAEGDGGTLVVNATDRAAGQVRLFVSPGTEYDSDEDVTNQTFWEVLGDAEFPIGVINDDGGDRGLLILSGTGRLQVRATWRGRASTLTVVVN